MAANEKFKKQLTLPMKNPHPALHLQTKGWGRHRRHWWCRNQQKRSHPGSQSYEGVGWCWFKKRPPQLTVACKGVGLLLSDICYQLLQQDISLEKHWPCPSSLTTMGVMVVEEEKKCVNKTHAIPKMDIFKLKFVFTAVLRSTTAIIDVENGSSPYRKLYCKIILLSLYNWIYGNKKK